MIGPFIFLDIDGVLNGHKRHANGYCGLDSRSVGVINNIIEGSGAKIVISSAWRYFVLRGEMNLAGLGGLLCTHGLKWGCVIDILGPDISDGNGGADRGAAIKKWFGERFCLSHGTPHIAFDDIDLGYTKNSVPFFKTDPNKGLHESMSLYEMDSVITRLRGEA